MQTTTLGGTTAALAISVGIATVDMGTPDGWDVAGELHPKGDALGAASGAGAQGLTLGAGAAYGAGVCMAGALFGAQQPARARAATSAMVCFMAGEAYTQRTPVRKPSVARYLPGDMPCVSRHLTHKV